MKRRPPVWTMTADGWFVGPVRTVDMIPPDWRTQLARGGISQAAFDQIVRDRAEIASKVCGHPVKVSKVTLW